MRTTALLPALMLAMLPLAARADPPTVSPSAATAANEARWADLDAQSRVTEGDYEGAVQAEQHANAARKQAEELTAQAPRHPEPDRR